MRPDAQEEIYIIFPPIDTAAAATISREEAMATFLEAPFLPNATQMRVDHITDLLALLLEDPLRYAAIRMLCKNYTPEDSSTTHTLAEGARAKEHILIMLQAA